MADQVINWVMPYLERWDKLSTFEYGIIAMSLLGMIIMTIVIWKIYKVGEEFLYRKYQLHGWEANRGRSF